MPSSPSPITSWADLRPPDWAAERTCDMETIYADEDRRVTYDPEEGYLLTRGGREYHLAPSGQPHPLSAAPAAVRDLVRTRGLRDYVWYAGLAMPKGTAQAIAAHRETQRRGWAAAHPGAKERAEIDRLFAAAKRCLHSGDEDNVAGYHRLRGQAQRRMEAWRDAYPQEWAEEQATKLRAQAQHERDLATGAMVYDCDGSLSPVDHERRAAECRARAAELEAQAVKLSSTSE